ncbi:MAG TPA: Holliday junction branch migration protein RuvA [Pseudomonadales bacterium]|nr:Holliday junction branch migration protein RuvA [Pseudomonadales bacterium]
MIGSLTGIIREKQPPHLLIDVHGVGYEVEAPMTTFYKLPEVGQTTTLHTHFVVREDGHFLFGFFQKSDRTLFRELIKINGVGPKLALTLMSGMEADALAHCVQIGDITTLTRLPGVGKKTAERLVVELKDKLGKLTGGGEISSSSAASIITFGANSAISDAESALIALGYKPVEASKAVNAVKKDGATSEELIRLALKSMVK